MNFKITRTWDGEECHHQPTEMNLNFDSKGLILSVVAEYFDDPPPSGLPGEPCPNLWNYEVVEAFFLNDKNMYLEVELSPHGQHLVLLLNGSRNCIKEQLPLKYTSRIEEGKWFGNAIIPLSFLPPCVCKFNAYAIHGCGTERKYEALYPVPKSKFAQPDFHRLEYFQDIDMKEHLPDNYNQQYNSKEWNSS